MAVVVQLVEHRVVIPGVAGSSPVDRPSIKETRPCGGFFIALNLRLCCFYQAIEIRQVFLYGLPDNFQINRVIAMH